MFRQTKINDYDDLAKMCEARDILCGYCEADECEKCIVTNLINDAYNEAEEKGIIEND